MKTSPPAMEDIRKVLARNSRLARNAMSISKEEQADLAGLGRTNLLESSGVRTESRSRRRDINRGAGHPTTHYEKQTLRNDRQDPRN